MDSPITKASLRGKRKGPNPIDRAKSGTKHSLLVDGKGIPMALTEDSTNRHDIKLTQVSLQSMKIHRPRPTIISKQNICLDKGYDFPEVCEFLEDYGYAIHIPKRRETNYIGMPKYRTKSWVVERTHSWMNRFRHLLIRWEKRVDNYIAMLRFASA